MLLVLWDPPYYECDDCGCPFLVLGLFVKGMLVLSLLAALGYVCIGPFLYGWNLPLCVAFAVAALFLLFHIWSK